MELTEKQRLVLVAALDLHDRGQPVNADTIGRELNWSGMDVAGIVADLADERVGDDDTHRAGTGRVHRTR